MTNPLVSVIMAVHNGARFLPQAVDSILDQSLGDIEFIVVDDRSTDETPRILTRYARRDGRIRVLQSNSGLAAALNLGCGIAQGTYLSMMDSDDIAFPDKLERQVKFLQEHRTVAAAGGGVVWINDDGMAYGEKLYPSSNGQIRQALWEAPAFCHATMVMRREAYLTIGGYRKAFPLAVDYDLELRLADLFELANIPRPVLYHRVHLGQVTFQQRRLQALSSLAAQMSAGFRRLDRRDPIEDADTVTEQLLRDWGVDERSLNGYLVASLLASAGTMMQAGYLDRALQILHEAEGLIRSSSVEWTLAGNLYWKYGMVHRRRGELLRSLPYFVRGSILNPVNPAMEIVNRVRPG